MINVLSFATQNLVNVAVETCTHERVEVRLKTPN